MNSIKKFSSRKEVTEFLKEKEIDTSNWSEEKWLQINKGQAEIHMMALAESIWDAVNESTPKQLKAGEWHIPFEDKIKQNFALIPVQFTLPDSVRISVAMAARTSYTVVGEEKALDYEAMIGLHDRLLNQQPPHSSPFEHTARAMSDEEYYTAVKTVQGLNREKAITRRDLGWCNNLKGFIQYRYIVDNNLSL